jgi:hypothetical protein
VAALKRDHLREEGDGERREERRGRDLQAAVQRQMAEAVYSDETGFRPAILI